MHTHADYFSSTQFKLLLSATAKAAKFLEMEHLEVLFTKKFQLEKYIVTRWVFDLQLMKQTPDDIIDVISRHCES